MSAKNRKKTENFIINMIDKLAPGTNNAKMYKDIFKNMNDKEFDEFMGKLESGEMDLSIIVPNFADSTITVENNLELAKELNHEFFERVWVEGKKDTPDYLTPIKYLVVDLPLKRASQLLVKKMSVPESNKVVDALTGQPTGESKGARMSYPELQLCADMGLVNTMVEVMKYRGGDEKGRNAMNAMINSTGVARQEVLDKFSSGVQSTRLLNVMLTSMHLKNTLNK